MAAHERLGLIAGNGRFPFLLLDAARAHGLTVVVAAIKEEADGEMNTRAAADPHIRVHWLSLGELSKLIDTFKSEGVSRAVMAGQVKHKQIFSSIRPDWRLAKLLLSLRTRSTDMLLGAVAKVLGDEGIELISSTQYLEPLLALAFVFLVARTLEDMPQGRQTLDSLPTITAPQSESQDAVYGTTGSAAPQAIEDHWDDTHQIGRLLFTKYVAPFEITSLLILVATIGVIVLCKRDEPTHRAPNEALVGHLPTLGKTEREPVSTR